MTQIKYLAKNDTHRQILKDSISAEVLINWALSDFLTNNSELKLESGELELELIKYLCEHETYNLSHLDRFLEIYREVEASGVLWGALGFWDLKQIDKRLEENNIITKSKALNKIKKIKKYSNLEIMFPESYAPNELSLLKALGCSETLSESKVSNKLYLAQAQNSNQEIAFVSSEILKLKAQNPKIKVAVVLDSYSEFSYNLENNFRNFGIDLDSDLRQDLSNTQENLFVLNLLESKLSGLNLDRLKIILNLGEAEFGCLKKLLHKAGAGNSKFDRLNGKGDFSAQIRELSKLNLDLDSEVLVKLENLERFLENMRLKDSFKNYLNLLSQENLRENFSSYQNLGNKISLIEFVGFFKNKIKTQKREKFGVTKNPYAVKILKPNSALVREFDYVFWPQLLASSIPQKPKQDNFWSDKIKQKLNLEFNFNFELAEEPLFEEMKLPTRASKAKKIFENIISSSKLKTYLTVPLKDNSNNLQEPSVYFSDLLKSSESENLIDLSNYLFFDDKLGQRIKSSSDGNCPNSSQTNNLVVWIPDQVRDDKAQVRDDKAQVRNDGYRVNPETLNKLFKRYLGTDLTHPITPTRLEAIAECRFRAYVEKLLRVEVPREKGNDTDVLWLGNLAHEVLEKFYKTRQEQNVAVGNFDSEQRELLNKIYQEVSDKHIKSYVNPQREILNATVNWLKDSLFRLISNLEHDIAISGVRPRFFELKAGYDKKLSFMINNQEIYFGGIIDRIDWSVGQRVVIDYKTSSKANIVSKIAKSNLMTKHFQLPLYLRLVENIWPSAGEVDLFAYLVSIKGAGVSRVLGVKDDEFRERVLDDSREDGLFFGLKNILEPLLQGNIDFSSGPHCDFCQLNRVCRKND